MIFSLDASIAFAIMLLCVLVFAQNLAQSVNTSKEMIEGFELTEKALLIADSMVKNRDSNNTLLGACIVDEDKKRVLANQLSMANLRNAKAINLGEISVKSIIVKTKFIQETIMLTSRVYDNCITAKRFALIDNQKGIVEVETCREN